MNILLLSDIHGQKIALKKLLNGLKSKIDFCLVSGDITNFGTPEVMSEILVIMSEISPQTFFVTGNCDPKDKKMTLPTIKSVENAYYTVENFAIVGLSYNQITKKSRKILKKLYKKEIKVILLSHKPPYHTNADLVSFNRYAGSKEIRQILETYPNIILHACGHIHDSAGVDELGQCVIVNPGPVNTGHYAIVTIDEESKVKASLHSIYEMN
ncbi:MAG: metallophosphoesterase family protein [Candidatus Heimdallarchaeaceae archaeon]